MKRKTLQKTHSAAWFARQEARLSEPFKNTKRYYYRGAFLRILSIIGIPHALYTALLCRKLCKTAKAQALDYLGNNRAVTFIGAPGVGKTFSAVDFAVSVAEQQWEELKKEYFTQSSLIDHWIREGELDKIEIFRRTEESYLYFAEREDSMIPCLISSVPIRDIYGRYSYALTDDIVRQERRAPENSVLFNDESGLEQGSDTSRNAEAPIKEFYRFNRHFGNFILINTEQGETGNGKYIRVVTDGNIRLKRQENILTPNWAERKLEKRKRRFFKKKAKGKYSPARAQYIGEELYYREKYLETIGFRRIPYRIMSSEGNAVNEETGVFIFPRRGMASYDNRAFRNLYRCGRHEIDLVPWESMFAK